MNSKMTNDKTNKTIKENEAHPVITQEALAQLGDGQIAYVRPIRSEDVASLFPQAPPSISAAVLTVSSCSRCTLPTEHPSCSPTRARRQWRMPGARNSKRSACTKSRVAW